MIFMEEKHMRFWNTRHVTAQRLVGWLILLLPLCVTQQALAQEMSSPEFVQALKTLAEHGDMADVEFVANALHLRIKPFQRDSIGKNYVLEQTDSPFSLYYRIGPRRAAIQNRQSIIFSITVDTHRYCLNIDDVYRTFGKPLEDIPFHIRYLTAEEEARVWRERKHDQYSFHYDFPGAVNLLHASFIYAYQNCARDITVSQNQDDKRLPALPSTSANPTNESQQ
jgi:hypothetical protein